MHKLNDYFTGTQQVRMTGIDAIAPKIDNAGVPILERDAAEL